MSSLYIRMHSMNALTIRMDSGITRDRGPIIAGSSTSVFSPGMVSIKWLISSNAALRTAERLTAESRSFGTTLLTGRENCFFLSRSPPSPSVVGTGGNCRGCDCVVGRDDDVVNVVDDDDDGDDMRRFVFD